ncbi:OmpA family protein [Mesorhizobium sp. J428]|uniref:OmpA family protein n=1 Tax=Mesorhizobium sp. J428 TaxID=2898440 RepID=UPI0021516B31|nr:OmpA family protein [Mesorhizobium sp. J428]MCR5856365.1 OmpA family protein [Mesorhizobium sp. J428]
MIELFSCRSLLLQCRWDPASDWSLEVNMPQAWRILSNPSSRAVLRALRVAAVVAFAASAGTANAQDWILNAAASKLTYQSVKKNTVVETNSIRNIAGTLTQDGQAKVVFDLDSVDTGIDLRNVRMRFLFFETFKFPKAEVTAKVDPAAFAELPSKRRMTSKLPFVLNLHGVDKTLEANVVVTMITNDMVSVASESPVAVNVADFGLLPNIEKLQTAANVTNIVPTASVSFDFVFNAEGSAAPSAVAAAAPPTADVGPVATDASKASFSKEECVNRFEVISRTGAIYFRTASAQLDTASKPLLDAVVDVVSKCPDLQIEVSGHTDSDGADESNQRLSERRARAVAEAIVASGIPNAQLTVAGYGEARPVAPNDTVKNKALNRRIEFQVIKRMGAAATNGATQTAEGTDGGMPAGNSETSPDGALVELARSMQQELIRVGCMDGKADGDWGASSADGLKDYAQRTGLKLVLAEPQPDLLGRLRGEDGRVCPLACGPGEVEEDGQCVAIACPPGQKLSKKGLCADVTARKEIVKIPPKVEKPKRVRASEPAKVTRRVAPVRDGCPPGARRAQNGYCYYSPFCSAANKGLPGTDQCE